MTKEEILENNKLIAEFMGYVYFPYKGGKYTMDDVPGWRKPEKGHIKLHGRGPMAWYLCRAHKDLAFHWKWDWLMPVYHTTRKVLKEHDKGANVLGTFININSFENIDILYKGIVDFIKDFYNKLEAQ